jgi:predicted SprT family Zn-dependent metalloprotease
VNLRAILALCGVKRTFAQRLQSALGRRVEVYFENHGQRRIFVTPEPGGKLKIHLDLLFEHIDPANFKNLVEFIRHGGETEKQALIAYLKKARESHPLPAEVHPLQELLEALRIQYFSALPEILLVWGKMGKKSKQKSIRLASFWPDRLEIRLHPLIMDERVPLYYLQYLLYHELCHAWLILTGKAKTGEHHGPDFYALEDQFSQIEEARSWESNELGNFLAQIQSE